MTMQFDVRVKHCIAMPKIMKNKPFELRMENSMQQKRTNKESNRNEKNSYEKTIL
jgi:hypothetical protein